MSERWTKVGFVSIPGLFKRSLEDYYEYQPVRRNLPAMKNTRLITQIFAIAFGIFLFSITVSGQSSALAVQDTATLEQQFKYIQEKTRIYEGYRAIRNDVYLKMQNNALDSLNQHILNEQRLRSELDESNAEINTLKSDLDQVKEERNEAIRNRDSMNFLGINISKTVYNSVLWFVILGLAILVTILFISFRRAHTVTRETKEELNTLQEKYDNHQKSSREKYEKLVVAHHNELMKLKNR